MFLEKCGIAHTYIWDSLPVNNQNYPYPELTYELFLYFIRNCAPQGHRPRKLVLRGTRRRKTLQPVQWLQILFCLFIGTYRFRELLSSFSLSLQLCIHFIDFLDMRLLHFFQRLLQLGHFLFSARATIQFNQRITLCIIIFSQQNRFCIVLRLLLLMSACARSILKSSTLSFK